MNSYSKFTNLQINELVSTRLKKKCLLTEESVLAYMDSGYRTFDPCNNPVDAMPIIIENRIAIFPIETLGVKYWCAASDFEDIGEKEIIWGMEANNKNPLRAAMETYLLMKGAENGKV